jgi:hypothetical protein
MHHQSASSAAPRRKDLINTLATDSSMSLLSVLSAARKPCARLDDSVILLFSFSSAAV